MSEAQEDSAIMKDLQDLFAWSPKPYRQATKAMGGSLSTTTRDPAWYDMHLAPDRICKKIVHVKDLHIKIAAVVDEKLQSIRDRGITLQPPTTRGYADKLDRKELLERSDLPAENELSIQTHYRSTTGVLCVPIASALALHPQRWKAVLVWWPTPIAQRDAVCDGSLRALDGLTSEKRAADGTIKYKGPEYVDPDLWQELMEVCNKYGDMATWEMKSLSVGNGKLMLGVMVLATGKEEFEWQVCKGGRDHHSKKGHYPPPTIQLLDDPETLLKFGLDDPGTVSQTNPDLAVDIDTILDDALRRGGSSLEQVKKFDRWLMKEVKGSKAARKGGKEKGNDATEILSPAYTDLGSTHEPEIAQPKTAKGAPSSLRTAGFWKHPFRKRSQDDHTSPSHTADSASANSKPVIGNTSQDSTIDSSKKGKLSIFIPPTPRPFIFSRKPSRKRSSSKSPRKNAHARAKGKKADTCDGNGEEEAQAEDDRKWELEGPLVAQSILQQAWAQGVHAQSTFIILHSGNYEYVCFRHRETQTLYVSDVLHVPFLRDPGYAKLQIGLYIAAVEDALGRHRLEKSLNAKAPPSPGDNGSQGPSGTDDEDSNSSDDDDENDDDRHKPKRRRERNQDGQGAADTASDWAMWQAQSRNGLMLYLTYGVYNSIRPAVFEPVGYRGAVYGILTPPTSPLSSPESPPPFSSPPTPLSSPPISGKDDFVELFLTSEIGQRTIGVLHGGVAEINARGEKTATIEVIAKLAFAEKHKHKLVDEFSVYNHLISKGVKGVPPVLGIFHNAEDKGPYCLILRDAGRPICDSIKPISIPQIYQFLATLDLIHQAGIVHGNLRLDNLLVNDVGDVTIVDFDQARLNSDSSEHNKERQTLSDMLHAMSERLVPGFMPKV